VAARDQEEMAMADSIEPIAVVGMACRLPGARDIEEYWRVLAAGQETVSFFSEEQLRAAGVSEKDIADPDYVPAAPLMPDVDQFDADLFGMTAAEARLCDPQIRVLIEMCHAALENAGYDPFGMADSVGVYGTVGMNGYLRQSREANPELLSGSAAMLPYILNLPDYAATQVSYKLDLRGPSMTVLTACSSSLVAVHLAAQALRAGDCDAALAGGAVVELPLGHGHRRTPGGVLTADGHCRPFDSSASGTLFGSGAGVVVLKRLDDAIAAGDCIRAVIRGSAASNDGAAKVSYSAPSVSGQAETVAEAMGLAGVHPTEVDYVEAHATGTALGDPIEVRALADAYVTLAGRPVPTGGTAIGSVKSNIGHMNAVAGVAGLIKTVLMLEREALVPSIGVTELNPRLELDRSPFAVVTELRPWPRRDDRPRVAGVSSLGVGGTNVHVVLTEGPPVDRGSEPVESPRVVLWSARGEPAVRQLEQNLARYFGTCGTADFADAAATLQHGRTPHPVRRAAICLSPGDLVAALGDPARQIRGRARPDVGVAFLFPGQGSHRSRMAIGLYGSVRAFSIAMDECLELFEDAGIGLLGAWRGDNHGRDFADDPRIMQPLLFSVEYALAAMWRDWGIEPAALLGHSLGELTAATVAGVFDLPDAATLVAARGATMAAHPVAGGMLAVRAGMDEIGDLVAEPVAVAAINAAAQTVLAGPGPDLDRVAADLGSAGFSARRLEVSHAFHHPDWRRSADQLAAACAAITPRAPRIPLYSAMTGGRVTESQAADIRFWTGQMAQPVRFASALDALLAESGHRLLVEVGPGNTLGSLAAARGVEDLLAVASLPADDGPKRTDDAQAVLHAAAEVWANGGPIDWEAAGQPAPATRVAVPGYPYQRERHWIDPVRAEPEQDVRPAGEQDVSPFSAIEWVQRPRPAPSGPVAGVALLLLPEDTDSAMEVLLAVQRAGYRTQRLRPAAEYAEIDNEFRVRLGCQQDLERVHARLTERGVLLDAVIHAAAVTPFGPPRADELGAQLDATFTSLLALAKLTSHQPPGRPAPRLLVITTGSVNVSGDEPVEPAKAAAHGVVRTLLAEVPGLHGGLVDIPRLGGITELAEEIRLDRRAHTVALRGRRRWVPVERELEVPEVDQGLLRDQGVYLITGGFGGLGLVVARQLAESGLRPRLVLLGRRDPTSATASEDDPSVRHADAVLSELRALGAEVHTVAADVCQPGAVRAAIAAAVARFGEINGLFHLAGVASGGMIAFRDAADAAAVLAPKTLGTLHLVEAFADRPALDFTVLFGSRAGTDGLLGNADYAAANAFLDAMAEAWPLPCGRVLSIGWPLWRGIGMAGGVRPDFARMAGQIAGLGSAQTAHTAQTAQTAQRSEIVAWEGQFGASTHWMLDEHRAGRRPLMPGTGYLDLVVRVFGEWTTERPPAIELSDVVFRAALSCERPRPVRVVLTPAGRAYEFAVLSQSDGQWHTHVTGKVAAVAEVTPPIDVTAIRTRLPRAGIDAARPAAGEQQFTLGPRWRNIAEVWQSGDEKLLRTELLAAFASDLAEHRLHPALLDTVTAATRVAGEGSFVPFLYRRVLVHGNLPASFFGHVRRVPSGTDTVVGDIDLVTADGVVLVRIEGFTMRRGHLAGDPVPEKPEPVAVPADGELDGLGEREGARLLLRLLGGRVPPAVLVRPHANGQPLPLTGSVAPKPVSQPERSPAAVVPPAPEADETGHPADRLRSLWARTLGRTPADEDDFFEMGGDSLAAVELMAKIKASFGVELGIGLLLDARTFGALLAVLESTVLESTAGL
jgi:phthiocerol/phenolphthiocerol synthesis type-I polyketide synthase E